MSDSPLFRDVSIFPSHYKKTCIVTWVVDPYLDDAEFYIYRFEDGGAKGELCNETPVSGTTYADTHFYIPNRFQEPGYRVLALKDGKEYQSPFIQTFARTGRQLFGVAQMIIQDKYMQARQDGIPMLYYPLVRSGELSSSLDQVTGQREKAACTDDENDLETYYAEGYYRPFLTLVRLLGDHRTNTQWEADGLYDSNVQKAEFLAFPPVRAGDLVVDVHGGIRYIVGDGVQCDRLKGIVPICYNAQIEKQEHNHACYKVAIPTNYPEMVRRLQVPFN